MTQKAVREVFTTSIEQKDEITEFQFDTRELNRSKAIRELIEMGLEVHKAKNKEKIQA